MNKTKRNITKKILGGLYSGKFSVRENENQDKILYHCGTPIAKLFPLRTLSIVSGPTCKLIMSERFYFMLFKTSKITGKKNYINNKYKNLMKDIIGKDIGYRIKEIH